MCCLSGFGLLEGVLSFGWSISKLSKVFSTLEIACFKRPPHRLGSLVPKKPLITDVKIYWAIHSYDVQQGVEEDIGKSRASCPALISGDRTLCRGTSKGDGSFQTCQKSWSWHLYSIRVLETMSKRDQWEYLSMLETMMKARLDLINKRWTLEWYSYVCFVPRHAVNRLHVKPSFFKKRK